MIEQFKKNLRKHAKSPGGTFWRSDFHVHLPGSSDYEYKGSDAYAQMGKALTDGQFGIAVILKHQEFPTEQELEKLAEYCPHTTLIPGAEINVFVDTLSKKVSKDHFFHCIVAADPNTPWAYLLHKAKENLSYGGTEYPAGFHSSIRDVARLFTEAGALFIPAHLHQSKPPQNSRSIDDIYDDDAFLDFVGAGVFSALEVREIATAEFFDGETKTNNGTDIPAAVCVQSSDAHSHQHVIDRNRSTWVQMETPCFSELQAALSFRHRVRLEAPSFDHPRIVGIHVVGQFLNEEWVSFNAGINCLIGCKGSGKTSILECLRFVLNTDIPPEREDSVKKHLHHILGPSGYVECLVRQKDGSELLLVRRADSPDRIKVVEQSGIQREILADNQTVFDVAILGWHEIEAVADHASARIKLLDRVEGEEMVKKQYTRIDTNVEKARDLLPTLQRRIKRLDGSLRELWALQKKRDTLAKLKQGDLLDLQTQYECYLFCEQELKTLQREVIDSHEKMKRTKEAEYQFLSRDDRKRDGSPTAVNTALTEAKNCEQTLKTAVDEALKAVADNSATVKEKINTQLGLVRNAFAQFRSNEYEPRVNTLPTHERDVLTRQIQIIEETKNLADTEATCRSLQAEVKSLAKEMHGYCDSICKSRETICKTRQDSVAKVNSELKTIRLKFNQSANHSKRHGFQKSYKEDAGDFFGFVDAFGNGEAYEKLRALFSELMNLEIEEEKWSIKDLLWDAKFVEFLRVLDDDDIEIEMEVGQAGFLPIQNLSAGQRCTAVFPLLLRNTRGPLVIDQPEDNLDNRYIADAIAPDLLKKKESQQFIATSHNANLVVLTDSDLILHADSDGRTGSLVTRGFFGCAENEISKSVLDVLDGGEQALLARQQKYGS